MGRGKEVGRVFSESWGSQPVVPSGHTTLPLDPGRGSGGCSSHCRRGLPGPCGSAGRKAWAGGARGRLRSPRRTEPHDGGDGSFHTLGKKAGLLRRVTDGFP